MENSTLAQSLRTEFTTLPLRSGDSKDREKSHLSCPKKGYLQSQDQWKVVSLGYLIFYLTADSYKGKNKSAVSETPQPEEYVLPDSLKHLRYLAICKANNAMVIAQRSDTI